jgi:hypothetical protein
MKPQMRPDWMTDGEINAELVTATGDRLAELEAEKAERKTYRANWNPDPSVGWKGTQRAGHGAAAQPAEAC